MTAIYKKELKSFFNNMTGYIFIAFILLIAGIFFSLTNLNGLSAKFEYATGNIYFLIFVVVSFPILTMRVLSEERHSKTDQLLYSLPVGMKSVVIAKYLAMITIFGFVTLALCLYPIILSFFGTVPFLSAYSSIAGFFLLGSALISVGMFISSLTESQVISAILSLLIMELLVFMPLLTSLVPAEPLASFFALTAVILLLAVIVYIMLRNFLITASFAVICEGIMAIIYYKAPSLFKNAFQNALGSLSAVDIYFNFINGYFDLTAAVYYITLSAFFVFLTVQSVEKRRWS